ncbi:DUF2851 family protein, partial [Akkermansiaceae bacterium]|nr:DUF2851 family protein [Akkermansiaceae bacterium]
MTYAQLLDECAPATNLLAENSAQARFDEIEIQSHWFAGHFSREHTANHGQKVRIISPGEWNRGAGPDFLAASVEIDGETLSGPIELDL